MSKNRNKGRYNSRQINQQPIDQIKQLADDARKLVEQTIPVSPVVLPVDEEEGVETTDNLAVEDAVVVEEETVQTATTAATAVAPEVVKTVSTPIPANTGASVNTGGNFQKKPWDLDLGMKSFMYNLVRQYPEGLGADGAAELEKLVSFLRKFIDSPKSAVNGFRTNNAGGVRSPFNPVWKKHEDSFVAFTPKSLNEAAKVSFIMVTVTPDPNPEYAGISKVEFQVFLNNKKQTHLEYLAYEAIDPDQVDLADEGDDDGEFGFEAILSNAMMTANTLLLTNSSSHPVESIMETHKFSLSDPSCFKEFQDANVPAGTLLSLREHSNSCVIHYPQEIGQSKEILSIPTWGGISAWVPDPKKPEQKMWIDVVFDESPGFFFTKGIEFRVDRETFDKFRPVTTADIPTDATAEQLGVK